MERVELLVPVGGGMSVRPSTAVVVPELTARVARASNPAGTTAMWVRDCLDGLWQDEDLATWYPSPGFSPARLATASLLQFLLHLSVRQAAEAVRCRIDFKYALAMELDDPGFHHRLLSDFRERLGEDDRADALLSLALARLRSARLFIERGRQRTDSTHVWSAARDLTRLEMVLEAVRAAPEEAAVLAPEVLDGLVVQDWASRYGRPVRLPAQPSCPAGRLGDAGQDSRRLLERLAAIGPLGARADVRRRILVQNFLVDSANRMRPRRPADGVPKGGRRLASPYYADARRVIRGNTRWAGYLVHVTETCDDESVNLITNIATTGPVRDTQALPGIHTRLGRRGLLPVEHLNDGYLSVEQLQDSHSVFGIDLVGPVEARGAWQKKAATGFARDDFTIDFDARTVTCPAGEATPPAPGAPHPPWPPTPHAKTHLQQVLTAIAIDLQQLATQSRTPSPRRIDTFQQDLDSARTPIGVLVAAGQVAGSRSPRESLREDCRVSGSRVRVTKRCDRLYRDLTRSIQMMEWSEA